MSEAGENSQAKLPVSSPVSGREILGLTSPPLTEGGKCALGEVNSGTLNNQKNHRDTLVFKIFLQGQQS
ncbi:hypothetical protein QQF64_033381 [Cirrhinus molitorella]|uniref:Uncharacterized protein n=1 Tax=Cirrhinus molitorella TaxID=172907 RepID=A0ABR3MTR0_9TELE